MEQHVETLLEEKDVRAVVRHPDPEVRAQAAQKICRTVRDKKLSDIERLFARRLLAHMAEDAVAIVRRALAVTLKNSPELPHEIALKLASDIDNIAVPVLQNSPVFTDLDLIEILRSKAAAKVRAVAKRPNVSGDLVRAIIRYGDSYAVADVAANDGAEIDPATAAHMLELYHDNDLLKNAFIARRDLPVVIMEKLITMVSEEAALTLQSRHDLPTEIAIDLITRTRERATLDLTERGITTGDARLLCERLKREGRLTSSLIIRMAGMGQMILLRHALALRADIKSNKAALMIHDAGPLGVNALCQAAGLNRTETQIIQSAGMIYRDLELACTEYDADFFQSLMIERLLTQPIQLSEADQTWFLERLDGLQNRAA